MASAKPDLEVIETGLEPRFFVNVCVRHEVMPDGMILLTYGLRHGSKINVEYSVLVSTSALLEMARQCQHLAAEAHNTIMFRDDLGSVN
jgi:hypothetical protein